MLFHLVLAICTIDPFILRNFSHIFSVCSVLLFALGVAVCFFLFQQWIVRNFYHWFFGGGVLLSSVLAGYLAVKSNRDLWVCFLPERSFFIFRTLVVLVSGITLLLLLIGSRMIGLGMRRS